MLYIHVLHLRSIEQVRRDVLELERRLVAAVGSERSLQAVERRLAEVHGDEAPPDPDREGPS